VVDPPPPPFDPYPLLQALDDRRVAYIVIGGFARVLQGTEELTWGLDVVPSMRPENLPRLEAALNDLDARRADDKPLQAGTLASEHVVALETEHGELKLVPEPAGTRGYDDLRRAATREPIGKGLRPQVASVGDLARMVSALDEPERASQLTQLRRIVELELARGRGIER
jgi:hypothetical protein